MVFEEPKQVDFSAIRLKLASPEIILGWSFGEVTKPETINYRTQKPEKSGLFAEEIFGPTKDWECYCGKYKRVRYKGIVCDKCGVEVTRSIVRRERMGHIRLAAPVSHIWFLRGVPSKIGLCLDLSVQDLEKVIYFASYVIMKVDDNLRQETLKQIESEEDSRKKQIDVEHQRIIHEVQQRKAKELSAASPDGREKVEKRFDEELAAITAQRADQLKTLDETAQLAKRELKGLAPLQIISEQQYHDLSLKYGHVFEAGIGAEAIHQLLMEIDIDTNVKKLEGEERIAPENRKRRILRQLKLFKNFKKNRIRPEWMILTIIPIIPPDLRPMVQLDGGRFAASDLNDLYRRVINRNNRLKRLVELNAPEVICRNEKRMLQEAVDALIDNSARHGKTVTAATGQKRQLKSIADMLKGKQGRFRQNLLGKRVDYSGRSVIVVGPNLKLSQCGLPKQMALELFKPFVIAQLIKREYVHNVRSATRFIEGDHPEVWDILEEITRESHVLLNRAPTLHRLGIQAFQPILIEGKAIQIHPLVCTAFNADFDGDQMAVHVPLTEQAKWEARELMLSTRNLLKPATGTPVVTPSQDIVLGCFYLTFMRGGDDAKPTDGIKHFSSSDEALLVYHSGRVNLREAIRVKREGGIVTTTVGRIIFNNALPADWPFLNTSLGKRELSVFVSEFLRQRGPVETVELLDAIKRLAFEYLTRSGISWGMDDLTVPKEKTEIVQTAGSAIDEVQTHFDSGLLTDEERHSKVIEIWDDAKTKIQDVSRKSLDRDGPVFAMIESGARGSWGQTTQMMGMKGLVTNPAGDIIELPVTGSFKEGFNVLEYFISTHGARKGLSDTALRTASAGYLTRRLIDVAQDVVVTEEDCGDAEGVVLTATESEEMGETLAKRILGRFAIDAIKDGRKTVVKAGELVEFDHLAKLNTAAPSQARIRSVVTCQSHRGVCQKCYGWDLGSNRLVDIGTAVGIVAAQSIGEPGTQLTMRTFHTGGVAGEDITQGLPRVEELFEARPVKKPALVSDVDGVVSIVERVSRDGARPQKVIVVSYHEEKAEQHEVKAKGWTVVVANGDRVSKGNTLAQSARGEKLVSRLEGTVALEGNVVTVSFAGNLTKEYVVPPGYTIWTKDGEKITRGDQLTEGSLDLQQLYYLKGKTAVQKYIIKEIQYIYSSQGQNLNDKHIEVIVRQMFSRVYVKESGDTELLSGEVVEQSQFARANEAIVGKELAVGETLLLGITKASLSIDSFLSAASFQETARVLIDAAVSGKIDRLRGLKENVIIGKLIPAGTGFRKTSL